MLDMGAAVFEKHEVLDPVVVLDPIDVMDDFAYRKRAIEMFRHDETVLFRASAMVGHRMVMSNPNSDVAILVTAAACPANVFRSTPAR
jgi:hypothetical protein